MQSTIDTGSTVTKINYISTREFLKRKGEMFRRCRPSTVAAMIEENAAEEESIFSIGGGMGGGEGGGGDGGGGGEGGMAGPVTPGRRVTVDADEKVDDDDLPYLLLDVRSEDEYTACHIAGGECGGGGGSGVGGAAGGGAWWGRCQRGIWVCG